MTRTFIFSSLAILFVACSVDVSRDDLVGTWEAKGPKYEARLVLRGDGTFQQNYFQGRLSDGTSQGTWSLERNGRRSYVLLQHIGGNEKNATARGVSSHTVTTHWGHVVLDDDPDQDVHYKKVDAVEHRAATR